MIFYVLILLLFALNAVYRVLVRYPPGLPKYAGYDNHQIDHHYQYVYCPADGNTLRELLHPHSVDMPCQYRTDDDCRSCHNEYIPRQHFQDAGSLCPVHLADGNLLAAAVYLVGGIPISPISMMKNMVTAAIKVALRNTRTEL